jgi:hypothetical protein
LWHLYFMVYKCINFMLTNNLSIPKNQKIKKK